MELIYIYIYINNSNAKVIIMIYYIQLNVRREETKGGKKERKNSCLTDTMQINWSAFLSFLHLNLMTTTIISICFKFLFSHKPKFLFKFKSIKINIWKKDCNFETKLSKREGKKIQFNLKQLFRPFEKLQPILDIFLLLQ